MNHKRWGPVPFLYLLLLEILRNQKLFFFLDFSLPYSYASFGRRIKLHKVDYLALLPVYGHSETMGIRQIRQFNPGSITSRLFKQQEHTHAKLGNSHPHPLACNLNVLWSLWTSDCTPLPCLLFVGFFTHICRE